MSLKLKPYPEYRDSGVSWMGEIPAHWRTNSLRRLARVQLSNVDKHTIEGEVPIRLCNYTDVYHRNFITPGMDFMNASALPREIEKFELREGDVLITKDSESWTDIAVPACVTTDLPGVLCGYHLAQIRPYPETVKGEYLFRAFQAEPVAHQFRVAASGVTRFGLSGPDLASGLFPVPPRQEQEGIIHFLDRVDRLVDRLIRTKQRLIELLNEQKQAIIHRVVTRGLDPDAPMKTTGLDWLPEVPEHWEVRKLKHVTRFVNGFAFKPSDWKPAGIPIIRIQNLNGADGFNYTDRSDVPLRLLVQPGDLLFSWSGNRGTSFGPFLWDRSFPAYLNQHIFKLLRYSLYKHFFYYALRAVTTHIEEQTHGIIGLVHITKPQLETISVPVPSTDEQAHIAQHLDTVCEELEQAIERARREIQLIREYRTRLISDVVTGKLDVREEATVTQPKKANKHFHRSVLAAEIVDQYQGISKFGRIKLQKAVILAERHLRMNEIQSKPRRAAAGPFDNQMMQSIHKQLEQQKWFKPTKSQGGRFEYVPMGKRGGHRRYFETYWGEKRDEFDRLLALLKPMTTDQAEIVATLYMAWNDFLIRGEQIDDDKLVHEVLHNWDKSKQRFTKEQWRTAISWMRKQDLVPQGFGATTAVSIDVTG